MRTPGQIAYEAYATALGYQEVPWDSIGSRSQAAWESAARAITEQRKASGNFAAATAILEEAKKNT